MALRSKILKCARFRFFKKLMLYLSSLEIISVTNYFPKRSTQISWLFFFFFFKLYIIVLVLPNIKMNPPQMAIFLEGRVETAVQLQLQSEISWFLAQSSEEAMAPHSSTLAWRIPWTEEPVRLQSMGSLRLRDDWATTLSLFTFMHWRRKWQPTPVFLPGESQGRGSLVGCRLWGRTESDTTKATQQQQLSLCCSIGLWAC